MLTNLKFTDPGKQVICKVKNITNEDDVYTVQLAPSKHDQFLAEPAQSVDKMVPGSKVLLKAKRVLNNGLEVTFNGENIGYVNQIHLQRENSACYSEDEEIQGTLLYALPSQKLAYFSEIVGQESDADLERGDIVEKAEVVGFEYNCIYFRLNKVGARALVPFSKTDIAIRKIEDFYKRGNKHVCRVLTYELMDQVYICSTQKSVLREKYMSVKDFRFGQKLKVKVVSVKSNGVLNVSCEKIFGSVFRNHINDPPMKRIPAVGTELFARVLTLKKNENGVLFTLRPSLVFSVLPPLSSIAEAKASSVHPGLITYVDEENGLFVRFYNEVMGQVKFPVAGYSKEELLSKYRVGDVHNFVVDKVEDDKLLLKLGIWEKTFVDSLSNSTLNTVIVLCVLILIF